MKTRQALLVQLPIPQLNFGRQTGNIPLGAGCLKIAAGATGAVSVDILAQPVATYMGDAALLDVLLDKKPDIVGFSVYAWNLDRSIYLAAGLKSSYGPRIVFGGPEITADNPRLRTPDVDFFVYGAGEAIFRALLKDDAIWTNGAGSAIDDQCFERNRSPYLANLLEPEIENMMLVETQRGCPYRCGYCYYGKSRKRLSTVPADRIIDAIRWARDRSIREVYLLDPCLNSRNDLIDLLAGIARINRDKKVRLISEIRAEAVDERLADGFTEAGFTWFEIGLQSINPKALHLMNRPTDLKAFVQGTRYLKDRNIKMGVDLIAGLPGDNPAGFSHSVTFVVDNGLADGAQVFPLSVLPGTPFRKNAANLGIAFVPYPPYTVVETPAFSSLAIASALDEAQERFDLCLYPLPDLDLSSCNIHFLQTGGHRVCKATMRGMPVIRKVMINNLPPARQLSMWSGQLAHPYQIVFGPLAADIALVCEVVRELTAANPFTPLEVVFIEPPEHPAIDTILAAAQLHRPHYLDIDMAFLYRQPGNRAILFTLLSKTNQPYFQAEMQRQVYWWTQPGLPSRIDLAALEHLDGIFIPDTVDKNAVLRWQDDLAPQCHDLPALTFAEPVMQKRWMKLTVADEYWLDVIPDG